MKRLSVFGVAWIMTVFPTWASAQSDLAARKTLSSDLAKRIDKIIYARLQEAKLQPGAKAEWAQLTRRLHIDLSGKIPNAAQLADMIDRAKDSATKLEDRIDTLLDSADYAVNFAHYWRFVVLRGHDPKQRGPFENWMRGHLTSNTRYNQIAREVIGGQGQQGAAAFNQNNLNKIENLAGATARIFLGLNMECAECHDHPTGAWKRKQFWEFAAFFANQGGNDKEVKIPQSTKTVTAKFLTGEEPDPSSTDAPRVTVANWVTSPKNAYFAKASVNHVWQYFFGVNLVEPIQDPSESSPPPQPELLEELAKSFIDSNFDLKVLIRAIMLTDAYQRGSVVMSDANRTDIHMFAKMPMRSMSPEQLFDSVCLATEYRNAPAAPPAPPAPGSGKKKPPPSPAQAREKFLEMFRSQDLVTEKQTSVLQALYLMNGKFVTDRTQQAALQILAEKDASTRQRVEAMYIMVLSRLPRASELDRMMKYIDSSADAHQAVADMCWVLLNSTEFILNH